MPSLRARLLIWIVRNRHLLRGRLRPAVVDATFDVAAFRASTERAVARMRLPSKVTVEPAEVAGMPAEWLVPEGAPDDRVLLYVHGGGFISGGRASHRVHVARFARATGLRCLLFDYRLAPEHPFPAAPDDVLAAYRWLLEASYASDRIVVGGESAGATLTLSLLISLAGTGLPQPAAAFAISPVTDLTCAAPSFNENASLDIAPPGSARAWCDFYIGTADPADPRLSPLLGDFTGVCPLHLTVGGNEIHRDDVRAVAATAAGQGVDVTLLEVPGMVHAFPIMAPLFPEASQAFAAICAFATDAVA